MRENQYATPADIPKLTKADPVKPLRVVLLVLGDTVASALIVAWLAFLLWLVVEAVMTLVHWI